MKKFRLLEIILFYVHPKMVAMKTIIIYPDAIFRYIGELQFIIFNISKKYFRYLTQSIHVWVLITNYRCYIRNLKKLVFARFEQNMPEMDQNRHKQCQLNEP